MSALHNTSSLCRNKPNPGANGIRMRSNAQADKPATQAGCVAIVFQDEEGLAQAPLACDASNQSN